MNYLAHLFLAEETPESWIGNLLGDFVKGPLASHQKNYSPGILKGIETHRKVDYFTDTHSIHLTSRQRISKTNRRFSGIIIDICYDHFLAKNWSLFSRDRLDRFANRMYEVLEENRSILPLNLQKILPRIISENWLESYKTLEGIRLTFLRLSKRLKRSNNLAQAPDDLIENYHELESEFLRFFPELINYVENIHLKNQENRLS